MNITSQLILRAFLAIFLVFVVGKIAGVFFHELIKKLFVSDRGANQKIDLDEKIQESLRKLRPGGHLVAKEVSTDSELKRELEWGHGPILNELEDRLKVALNIDEIPQGELSREIKRLMQQKVTKLEDLKSICVKNVYFNYLKTRNEKKDELFWKKFLQLKNVNWDFVQQILAKIHSASIDRASIEFRAKYILLEKKEAEKKKFEEESRDLSWALKMLGWNKDKFPTELEIKKAYNSYALKYHPDKLANDLSDDELTKAKMKFVELTEAYEAIRAFLQKRKK